MQEWGSDLGKESSLNSATQKYTDFLLATASGKVEGVKGPGKLGTPFEKTKIAAYTLGAMTPCMRLYAFIGKELQALLDSDISSHPYKKWIDNYSSEGFQVCHGIELLSRFSIFYTTSVVVNIYLEQATKLSYKIYKSRHVLCKSKTCLIN